jgi:hypothetical protein
MRDEPGMKRDGEKRVRGLDVHRRPTRRRGLLGGLAGAALACALLWLAPAALADEFTVAKLDDDGPGTLRTAIQAAHITSGDDTITITATGTIALESALPPLQGGVGKIAINGPGADRLTVRRSPPSPLIPFRIFEIESGAEVTIDGLTVANGWVTGGGGGGGIFNDGTLALVRSTISGNRVTNPAGGSSNGGGGILNHGTLVVDRSTISENTADAASGGGDGVGGGIRALGDLTVSRSTISGNTADVGGGIGFALVDTTLLASVTMAHNEAGLPGEGHNLGGHIDRPVTLQNTIAVRPPGSGVNCEIDGPDALTSAGYNLADDASCELTEDSDRPGVDPGLGPLADNGGPTESHAIAAGSPAIDKGFAAQFGGTDQRGLTRPSVFPAIADAPGGDGSDIGAFELQAPSTGGPPSNEFSFGRLKKNKKRGTAKLTVIVPGPGDVELAKTKKVKAKDKRAAARRKVKLAIKPKPKAKRKLKSKGKAKVKANVTYTPDGGTPNTQTKPLKLVKR